MAGNALRLVISISASADPPGLYFFALFICGRYEA
jgi:hypothetical protein